MKKIILIFMILVSILVVGCTINNQINEKQKNFTEEKSQIIAYNHLKNSEEYINNQGKNLKLVEKTKLDCEQCWNFRYMYDVENKFVTSDTTGYDVIIPVEKGTIGDIQINKLFEKNIYLSTIPMEESKAKEIANKLCEGKVTSFEGYNNNSNTWWFSTDIVKKGCSPACVVDNLGNVETNWRCTGLIEKNEPIKEDFCGTSTESQCKEDSDCIGFGCSGQVCGTVEESTDLSTTCDARECYNSEEYGLSCGCVSGRCMWS